MINFLGDQQAADGPMTFAEPQEGMVFSESLKRSFDLATGTIARPVIGEIAQSVYSDVMNHPEEFGKLNTAAERQTRLAEVQTSHGSAIEEAYDRRIQAVKDATGIELDNPERYRLTERDRRQLLREGVDAADIPTYQRRLFEDKLAAARNTAPDKADALTFGNIDDEAKAIAKGAEDEYEEARKNTKLSTASSLLAQFGGAFQGSLRDPLFVGSMFAGPTTAVGKTVAARIVTSALFQGAYNAGITALEQPAVQAWRAAAGIKSGVEPAIENIGMAFLMGAIPGAVFRGLHEAIAPAARPAIERVMKGTPEPGDLEKVMEAAKTVSPEAAQPVETRAVQLGEQMDEATRATRPAPQKGVTPELHDDLTQAALRHADNPSAPTPQAVAAVNAIEAYHGSPHDFEAFDLSKIGSGEGAQSYGHGLYFAESEGVAQSYKLALEDKHLHPDQEGMLYRVRIHAEREHMLDWDKPLSEQSEYVKEALKKLGVDVGPQDMTLMRSVHERARTGEELVDHLKYKLGTPNDYVGTILAQPRDISKILHEAGILGIKYLDQGSRPIADIDRLKAQLEKYKAEGSDYEDIAKQLADAEALGGKATSNFVIFDDKLIDITHKNDVPLSPVHQEVEARIAEAKPQSRAEAEIAASEALEDIGNRQTSARLKQELAQPTLPEPPPPVEGVKPAPASSKDPLDKIPWTDADGNTKLVSAQALARQGERETLFSDIIRECK